MKPCAFITGINGFIASHLAKKLLERGQEVVGLGHDHRAVSTLSRLGLENKVTMIYGDVRDSKLVRRIITQYHVDHVYHMAARSTVSVCLKDPVTTFDVNALGTVALLDACRGLQLDSIFVSSTDKVYGEGMDREESESLRAIGIYEVSKMCSDYIAHSFQSAFDLPIIVARTCNVYGEYDFNRRIIPNTVLNIKAGVQPIIFKDDESVREYIYVDDACEAYVQMAENVEVFKGKSCNVGSGCIAKQYEIVNQLLEISGTSMKPRLVTKSHSVHEIYRQSLNSTQLRRTLGWAPVFDLQSGLTRTWERWD